MDMPANFEHNDKQLKKTEAIDIVENPENRIESSYSVVIIMS